MILLQAKQPQGRSHLLEDRGTRPAGSQGSMGYLGRPAPHCDVPGANERHAGTPTAQGTRRADRLLQEEQDSA